MNPDIDDPNNHAPEISPGDDWDDLDVQSEKSRMGLPPRRLDRGLPPKKEARGRLGRRDQAESVDGADKKVEDAPEVPEDDGGDDLPRARKAAKPGRKTKKAKKPAAKSSRKAAKKTAKKSSGKNADTKVVRKPSESSPPVLTEVDEEEPSVADKEIRLPPAPQEKPSRLIHSIGTGNSAISDPRPAMRPATGPVQKIKASQAILTDGENEEEIARQRRRFIRGERWDWGEGRGRASLKWMVLAGTGVLGLLLLAAVLGLKGGKGKTRESDKSLYGGMAMEEEDVARSDDLELLAMLTQSQEVAREIFGKYAAASSPGEVSGLLLHSEAVAPLVAKDWKPLSEKADWVPGDEAVWSVQEYEGDRYGTLEGTLPDFTGYLAFFRKNGDELKLDWKATTGYGSATFDELKQGKGDGGEIRGWLSPADFYTFAMPEEKFRSFRMMSPDGDSNLWVYTPRDGELDVKLTKLFIPSEITGEALSEARVTLSLEPGPEEGLSNQWLVRGVESLSWLEDLQK